MYSVPVLQQNINEFFFFCSFLPFGTQQTTSNIDIAFIFNTQKRFFIPFSKYCNVFRERVIFAEYLKEEKCQDFMWIIFECRNWWSSKTNAQSLPYIHDYVIHSVKCKTTATRRLWLTLIWRMHLYFEWKWLCWRFPPNKVEITCAEYDFFQLRNV